MSKEHPGLYALYLNDRIMLHYNITVISHRHHMKLPTPPKNIYFTLTCTLSKIPQHSEIIEARVARSTGWAFCIFRLIGRSQIEVTFINILELNKLDWLYYADLATLIKGPELYR